MLVVDEEVVGPAPSDDDDDDGDGVVEVAGLPVVEETGVRETDAGTGPPPRVLLRFDEELTVDNCS